jgi:hypothetical protein
MASGTDGNIISYDASGNPVAIATGDDGQVLTSAGAGAQPAFEDAAGGGAWTFISTQDISSTSAVTFTGIDSTYDCYAFIGSDIQCASHFKPTMRCGDSGGIDTGTDYAYHCTTLSDASSTYDGDNSSATTIIRLSDKDYGSDAGEGIGFECKLMTPADAVMRPVFQGMCVGIDTGGGLECGSWWGQRTAVITLDRVQFYDYNGNNMDSGRITLYGIKHS